MVIEPSLGPWKPKRIGLEDEHHARKWSSVKHVQLPLLRVFHWAEWWICPFADVGWCPHPKQGFRHTSGAPSCGWNGQVFAVIGQERICGQAIHTHGSSTHIWRWEVAAWEHMLRFEQKALVARNARSARSARTLESPFVATSHQQLNVVACLLGSYLNMEKIDH